MSNSEKHTPGPWRVVEHEHYPCFQVLKGPSFDVKVVMSAGNLTFEDGLQRQRDLDLIATAPDLYEALQEARKDVVHRQMDIQWLISTHEDASSAARWKYAQDIKEVTRRLEKVDAALAAARGEQPEGGE